MKNIEEDKIPAFVAALGAAQTFEEGAHLVLRSLLEEAHATLVGSAYATRGRILRGMVHLRPSDGYRRLVVDEFQNTTPSVPSLPSATAWRWVSESRTAVSIDVELGLIDIGLSGKSENLREQGAPRFDSKESRARLLDREATHVLALPLRALGREISGMISLEALCHGAMGKRFIWADCLARLEMLVGIAAPYLAILPYEVNQSTAPDDLLPVIGSSMVGVVEMLRIFAQQEETVVLSGPTGAGKSRLARWCHQQSPQREHHFETLDLSTIPEDLQMAEFFGWKKGAFTGATKDTPGSLARAENGTLFVDEIDKLSLKVQAGLLRVLEERRYRPLGDSAGDRSASVRFIIGTNADLFAAVRAGHFREDLYYRLNVLPIKIPPLDERKDEIPQWARYMLERRHLASGKETGVSLSNEAEQALRARAWPGNLRQLDNIVRRAYALSLMEKSAASAALVITGSHVEKALAYESNSNTASLLELMTLTAMAFLAEAERRSTGGSCLDLDHTDALRGFVLGIAAQKLGSREEAYRLFGKNALVETRNHQKSIKREIEKVDALCRAFGQEEKSPFYRAHNEDGQ